MTRTLVMTSLLLALFTLSISSIEARERGQKPPSFEEMDTNGDGVLSQDELKGKLLEEFEQLDLDGNGKLSEDELPEPPQKRR
ncbi:hypothetical protein EXU30_14820 [Shewanella maritima]|uniref:EF-hand domain-containing protein n=1 Tax=Shewanella maritima TaxID=2520507 RepID=A0A411PJZ5_9GAMM|nr:EF-hand domain-containing protein [Shewanella maritima]QBF83814.1 hypothetical protein EXU30_14820 [Shewanella maritima]